MSCDHVIGAYGAYKIRRSNWIDTVGLYASMIHFFRTTKLAVPHPGFLAPHAFCLDCGEKLNIGAANACISEGINIALDAALGSDAAPAIESDMSLSAYTAMIINIDSVLSQLKMPQKDSL